MAYKFQLGSAVLSGAVSQEGTIKVLDDSGNEKGSFTSAGALSASAASKVLSLNINSSTAAISSAGAYTGASVDVSGKVDGATGFDVNGTNVIDSSRNIANAGTLSGSGKGSFASIALDSVDVTATAAELNYVDIASLGTGAASKALVFDANGNFDGASASLILTASAVSSSQLELAANALSINGTAVTSTAAELNLVDGITAGTVAASKAVIADASKDVTGFRNVTGTGAITAGTSFIIGSADLNEADMEKIDGITNGTGAAAKALVLDSNSRIVGGVSQITASYFSGNGSGLTNISAGNVSAAGSDKQIQFNQNGDFAGDAGLTFDGSGSVYVSGSSSGAQQSKLVLGTSTDNLGYLSLSDDTGYIFEIGCNNGSLEFSGSDGVSAYTAEGANFKILSQFTTTGLELSDAQTETAAVLLGHDGTMSASAGLTIQSINVNEAASISSAGAGVLSSLNLGSGGITNAGALAGVTTLSSSNSTQLGGTLTAANLGTIADGDIDLTADLMIANDSATGAIKNMSLANYAGKLAGGSNEGLSSTAGRLAVDLNDLAAASVNVANDSIAIIDADGSNASKKESIADLVSAMAGGGLTATNGVLSTQVGSVASIADGGTLAEGYNYLADISSNATVSLPSGSQGDVIHVKAADLNSGAVVIINCSGSQTIDDDHTSIRIESGFGAASLVYVAANKWRLV